MLTGVDWNFTDTVYRTGFSPNSTARLLPLQSRFGSPTETFALVRGPVHEHFGGDDIPERQKHLHQFIVAKLLREVVDKKVASFRACVERGAMGA